MEQKNKIAVFDGRCFWCTETLFDEVGDKDNAQDLALFFITDSDTSSEQ